jgi:hypothetical protein
MLLWGRRMKRKTYPILAIALTASACGGTPASGPEPQSTRQQLTQELSNTPLADALKNRDRFAPLCDENGYPLPGNVNSKGSGSGTSVTEFCDAIRPSTQKPAPAAAPPSAPPPPATPPAQQACDRDTLNQDLGNSSLEDALANRTQFRCLCDDQGYPLVGNINVKGTKASEFCGALREKGLL